MSDVRGKLVAVVNRYLDENEEDATRIYVPKTIENEMTGEGPEFHPEYKDYRIDIRTFFGEYPYFIDYLLIWDSDELRAERHDGDVELIHRLKGEGRMPLY